MQPPAERPARARRMSDPVRYFIACFLLWVVVDFGTAGGFRWSYFEKFGPVLLFFYLGYPLVFAWLVFRRRWSDRLLFAGTLVAIFLVEVVFTRNPLLTTFPACLFGVPLAVLIYAPLTYFPLWLVRGELGPRRRMVCLLAFVEVAVMVLTTFGRG